MATEINNVNATRFNTPKSSQATDSREQTRHANEAGKADHVQISQDAKTIERVSVSISESAAFDEKKVAEIAAAIREDRYPVDPDRIAEKFMELEGQLSR